MWKILVILVCILECLYYGCHCGALLSLSHIQAMTMLGLISFDKFSHICRLLPLPRPVCASLTPPLRIHTPLPLACSTGFCSNTREDYLSL